VPSRYESTREPREPLINSTFLGDSALKEREENILQHVIHCIYEDVRRAGEGVYASRARGRLKMLVRDPWRVSRLPTSRKCRRQLRAACAGLVLILGVGAFSACGEASSGYDYETASHHEPAELEPIKGTDVQRVIFDAEAAKRVGLQTAPIRQDGRKEVMPYAALIYDAEGDTYAYTAPKPLTYVRQQIDIDHYDGESVVLSDGPPVGTEVVTVGVDEVYGTEFEVEE
jgi:hypothetical protein